MLGTDYHPPLPGAFTSPEGYGFQPGQRANVFRPPTTPSTASPSQVSSQYTSSTMADQNRPLVINKKRARQSTISEAGTPLHQVQNHDWSLGLNTGDTIMRSCSVAGDPGSPMPFVNTRYQIAGGLDTPTAQMAGYFEESEYSDTNYRRDISMGSANGRRQASAMGFEREYHSFARLPSTASMENNGQPRIQPQSPEQKQERTGWSQMALNVVGGVVGKVWQFCKAGAFSGFSAGGGQKYELDAQHTAEQDLKDEPAFRFEPQSPQQQFGMDTRIWSGPASPVPGRYPNEVEESGYFVNSPDYAFSSAPTPSDRDTPSTRPAKRRQISQADTKSGMDASWVVVNNSPAPAQQTPVSRRAPARFSVATASSAARRGTSVYTSSASRPGMRAVPRQRPTPTQSRLPTSQVSYAGSPALRTSTASYASPRIYTPSASRIPVAVNTSHPISHPISHISHPISTTSGSGSVSGRSTPTWRPTTPGVSAPPVPALVTSPSAAAAAAQAKKWAAKKKREDAETDVSMRRLNAQLKAMIREGKEALGTRVEVEMCDEDMRD